LREGWEVQLARAAVAKSMLWQPGGGEGEGEGGHEVVSQGQTRYTQAHGRREGWGGGGRWGDHLPALAIAIADAIEAPLVSWVWKWTGREVTSVIACIRGAAARGLRRPAMSWGKGGREGGREGGSVRLGPQRNEGGREGERQ